MANESSRYIGEELRTRLFRDADENAIKAEFDRRAEIENRIIEQERKKQKTESIARAIISLVYDTLKNADRELGEISKVDRVLGKLNDDDDDSKSGYVIDDDGLTITLDYSKVTYDMDTSGGMCFLGECGKKWDPNTIYYNRLPDGQEQWEKANKRDMEKESFDYNYLNQILNEYGISMSRENSSDCPGMEWIYTDIVTIKVGRNPVISHKM